MSKKEILFDVVNKLRSILSMDPLKEDFIEDTKLETETEVETEVVETETEVKLGESVLENGTVIYYDGDMLEVGKEVFTQDENGENVILPDGEYILDSGMKFTIVEGVVGEITEQEAPAEEAPVEEDLRETEMNELKDLINELNEKIKKFEKNETLLKAEIEKLGSASEVEPLHAIPQEKRELTSVEKKLIAMEAWNKKYGNI